jgi:uncharacterized protein YdbL (DUF1318 family)
MLKKLAWVVLLSLAVGGYVAHSRGYVGWALGFAKTYVKPTDHELLAFFPKETQGLVVLQLPFVAEPEHEKARRLDSVAADIEKITGVRMVDVDSVAIDPTLQVARGRFDWDRMKSRLEEHQYKLTKMEGFPFAVREDGGDALALVKPYLVHGDAAQLDEALKRYVKKEGLTERAEIVQSLDEVGWRHAALAAVQLASNPASLGNVLSGNVAPRGGALAIDNAKQEGRVDYLLEGFVIAGSNTHAKDMADQMEKARKAMVKELSRSKETIALEVRSALEQAKIEASAEARVSLRVVVPWSLVEAVLDLSSQKSGTTAAWWSYRLYQWRWMFERSMHPEQYPSWYQNSSFIPGW